MKGYPQTPPRLLKKGCLDVVVVVVVRLRVEVERGSDGWGVRSCGCGRVVNERFDTQALPKK